MLADPHARRMASQWRIPSAELRQRTRLVPTKTGWGAIDPASSIPTGSTLLNWWLLTRSDNDRVSLLAPSTCPSQTFIWQPDVVIAPEFTSPEPIATSGSHSPEGVTSRGLKSVEFACPSIDYSPTHSTCLVPASCSIYNFICRSKFQV